MANTGLVSLTYIQKISEKVWRPCRQGAGHPGPSHGPAGRPDPGAQTWRFETRPLSPLSRPSLDSHVYACLAHALVPPELVASPLCRPLAPPPALPPQVSLASDFMWNLNSREASASFGYDYILRQCRLRGRIDTGARHALAACAARVTAVWG